MTDLSPKGLIFLKIFFGDPENKKSSCERALNIDNLS
jgi:hypothetical protein